ncbi:MAG: hypothetical protein AAGJ74_05135 [Pseudomonadota bacterium]
MTPLRFALILATAFAAAALTVGIGAALAPHLPAVGPLPAFTAVILVALIVALLWRLGVLGRR